jgi:Glycosyltransferase
MKKKLLFVINTLSAAGAEMALLELLRRLSPDEYDISLYVLMGQGELSDRLPKYVTLLNKDYSSVSVLSEEGRKHMYRHIIKAMFCRGTVFRRLPYMAAGLFEMVKKHKIWPDKLLWRIISDGSPRLKERYDVAVAYLEGGSTYYVADYVNAKKKAAFIHIDYTQAGYTRRLDKNCYEEFDAIFPIAESVRDKFLEVYPEYKEKTAVFHNMLNSEEIKKKSRLAGGFADDYRGIRILSVGRLTWQKSYESAVEAMRLLKTEGYSARWYVLGEGSERQMLEQQIAKAGLEEDFILAGAVENPYPYYLQADICVQATRFEGKSIAIQEAQILGCAIVASDNNSNREQITDGKDGFLCKLEPEDIKQKIKLLILDKKQREAFQKAALCKKISYEEDLMLLKGLFENE